MNFVEPIRSKDLIEKMKVQLRKTGERNYLLFVFRNKCRIKNQRYYKIKSKRYS